MNFCGLKVTSPHFNVHCSDAAAITYRFDKGELNIIKGEMWKEACTSAYNTICRPAPHILHSFQLVLCAFAYLMYTTVSLLDPRLVCAIGALHMHEIDRKARDMTIVLRHQKQLIGCRQVSHALCNLQSG